MEAIKKRYKRVDSIVNSTKVSIIIPVYNVEQYLRQCLDSVCNQTFKDIEIIVVNDCSPDNSLQIIKEYQQKDNRIVLLDLKENIGLGFARNEGMKVAKGKYITFVDSDDWVTKDYVEVLYNTIEKYNYDVISPDFYEYDNITQKISKSKHPKDFYNISISTIDIKQKLLCKEHIHYVRKIYRLKFLKDNNIIFKLNKLEDTPFTWECILKTNKFMFIDNKIYYYRTNRKGSVLTDNNRGIVNDMNMCYLLKQMICENDDYKKYFDSVLNLFAMNRFIYSAWENPNSFKKLYSEFKKQFFSGDKIEFYHLNTFVSVLKAKLFSCILKFNINIILLSRCYTFFRKSRNILKKLFSIKK